MDDIRTYVGTINGIERVTHNIYECDTFEFDLTFDNKDIKEVVFDNSTESFTFTINDPSPFRSAFKLTNNNNHGGTYFNISKIYVNNDKNTVVVEWVNGEKTKVKRDEKDIDNLYSAVAAAVMKRKYGSNSAFKAKLKKMIGAYSHEAYIFIAMWETVEIFDGLKKFKEMVDEKKIYTSKKKNKED